MANNHRAYENSYPSVTQVLDVLRKIGLENWFKWNTPQFIKEASNKGKEIGTQIHNAIEAFILGQEVKVTTIYKNEVMNALNSFMLFRKEHPEITLQLSEVMMTSEQYKYNGTLDNISKIGDEVVVLDWKTGEAKAKERPDIYDEYVHQVSAYVMAYNEINHTDIKRAIIVSLAKDKVAYNYREITEKEIWESFSEVFLPALKIWYYKNKKKGE